MEFTKMQGAGNDFILVETRETDCNWSALSKKMCDRHYGIGADGLLLMMPSNITHMKMRIFNADGSESEICGNGLRCMIRYYLDKENPAEKTGKLRIETAAGIRQVEISEQLEIKVAMGKPVFSESHIPVKCGRSIVDIKQLRVCSISVAGNVFKLNLVSMGNPHAIYFTDNRIMDFPLFDIGPEITGNEIFPQGVNFEVAKIIDKENIEARVYERGVGETLACGSGACAIAVTAILHDLTENKVNVRLPGGILKIDWDGLGDVYLSGPAEKVYTGIWEV